MNPKLSSFDALIQKHGIRLATEGRSQKTIDWYTNNLRRFLQFLRNHQLLDSISDIGAHFIFHVKKNSLCFATACCGAIHFYNPYKAILFIVSKVKGTLTVHLNCFNRTQNFA